MKSLNTFLSELNNLHIKLWVEEGKLRCQSPKGSLTTDLQRQLTEHKAEIIQLLQPQESIPRLSRDTSLPLSFAQQRFWFLNQLEATSAAYHLTNVWRLNGPFNRAALEASLTDIVQRHESLRTTILQSSDGIPYQVVQPAFNPLNDFIDLQTYSAAEQNIKLEQLAVQALARPFNLETGPLLRVSLIQLSPEDHLLMITLHHIITDGWSLRIFIRELSIIYQAWLQGKPSPLPALSIQYGDYAAWQRQWLQGEVLQQQVDYWQQQLAGVPALLELPTDKPRPAQQSYHGAHYSQRLSPTLTAAITKLSYQHGVTVFMTLLTTFYILLSRYSRQTDLCVGSPIANRTHRQTEDLIGFFVNTLVLRAQLQPQQSFLDLLQATRQTCLDAYAHQDIPFEMLVEQLQPTRSLSYSPLFQVMFVLQNNESVELILPGLEITAVVPAYPIAKFDLTLSLEERDGQWHGEWEYATDLFVAATIERMAGHFEVLLTAVVANPTQAISLLPMLTVAEVQQLRAWNDTAMAYPTDLTLVDLFEQQVAKTPENLAVVFETQSLTYRQLNEKANQLAHYLLDLTTFKKLSNLNGLSSPNPLMAIAVERSLEMVIGLLGILKAGGAYVPIDPSYPTARIHYMLEDSAAPWLLTQSHLRAPLSLETLEHDCVVVCLEEATWAGQPTENPQVSRQVTDLAYVIYTSGSTGKPKGVMVEHQALTLHGQAMLQQYTLTKHDRVLQFASFSFDTSLEQVFLAWLSGACSVLVKTNLMVAPEFFSLLKNQVITVADLPPAFWQLLLANGTSARGLPALRLLILGGEALPSQVAQQTREGFPALSIFNAYGPTEAVITPTLYRLPVILAANTTSVAIGRPRANTRIYILDAHHQPQPPGVPGELCIAGAGLARGYLNRPDLTAAKFIEVELFGQTERIYKTGDLARWCPDGNLEYLGRLDHQVKLRGFRIELGEIEAVLCVHPAVKEAVVTLYEADDNKRLVAYLTTDSESPALVTTLKDWLTARLPDYMIPSHFIVLEKLPLTPNGKLDRQALPAPVLSTLLSTPPVTPTEDLLASLWARVLKHEAINREDNFFELGGHSLLATQLIARIRESFQVELPVRAVFEHPQLSSLATAIAAATGTVRLPPIEVQPANAPQLLSFAQQRLWFLSQLEENESATYNMPVALRLTGNLKVEALQQSLRWLLERHTSLRSAFPTQDGRATVQILDLESFAVLTIQDLRSLSAVAQSEEVQTRANRHALAPFELAQGPLFKAELLLLNEQESVLLLNWHHIISDGWSMGVFVRDWQHAYTALAQGEAPSLPALPLQYGDYAAWQRQWLQGEVLQQQVDYWQQQLAGVPALLELPTAKPRPAQQSYHGAHYPQCLSPTLTAAITSLSHQHGVTVFMTLLTTFYILLSRYSRQEDVCVGSPIANRTHRQTEDLIGFFVNTLVLRAQLQPQQNFLDLLRATRQTCLAAYAHQDLPFEMLVEQLQPTRSLSQSPLFQVMFVLQNNEPVELTLPDLEITALAPNYPIAKFDLTLSLEERDGQWHGEWEYATDLFAAATIERMAGHFEVLLTAVVSNPTQTISHLPMLTVAEVQQLRDWNQTQTDYPTNQTIVDLFQAQVENTPENLAVVFETQSLTYRQLNAKANQLAHYLLDLTTFKKLSNLNGLSSPNPLIAIAVERSLEMVIGLLGILKAGGTYVPLDPSYPAARIHYMLEDSAAPLLLTQSHLKAQLSLETLEHECVVVCLEEATWAGQATVNPLVSRHATDLAYVIYTSGSTGKPKGVMGLQRGVVNRCQWMWTTYPFTPQEVCCQKTSLSFVDSVWEIFGPLLQGIPTVIIPEACAKEPFQLLQRLAHSQVTRLVLVPSLLQTLLDNQPLLPLLKYCIVSGEALSFELSQRFQAILPQTKLLNLYGSSEVAADATWYDASGSMFTKLVPIGRPIANLQAYILDKTLQLVPLGVPGELHLGGAGLARGYLNRPELTADQFVELELFGQRQRIYKTGDLARWRFDGNLEYLGRLDHQVKLRGFRIELGEIEAVLCVHPAVKEAVVTLYEADDNKRLVAYLTTDSESPALVTTLKDWLTARLPDYMIPSHFIVLEKLPLTPNGKLDRQALPAPVLSTLLSAPPVTPTEDLLASLWAGVLKREAINREDNFFELGGHSLLATQLIARIRESFQVELPVRAIFEHPQLASLATAIAAATGTVRLPPIEVQPANAPQLLSFAQQRLWFLTQLEENKSATYNMPVALRLTGNLKVEALQQSLHWLLERHTSLRSAFPTQDGRATVQILDLESFAVLTIQDLRSLSTTTQSEEIQTRANRHALAPFELAQGPLFKAELLLLNEQESVLLLNWHHIISDGWSMGVFVRDWQHAYTALAQGEAPSLPALPLQYGDYAAWQRHWLQGEVLQQQVDYWHQQLAGVPALLELPTTKPRPAQQSYHGAHHSQYLSPTLTAAITSLSHQHGVTVFMTLLTTFYILLSRYSRQTDVCVGSPIANRTHRQTEDLIGFFVNTLVLRAQLQPQQNFLDLLQSTRQTCLAAYAHQDLPFEMLVEQLQPTRSLSHSPLFQVMFILQNNEPIELTLPDLEITALTSDYPIAKFDLTLSLAERDGQWHGEWEYATDLFAAETIERMAGHFEVLLTAIVANPTQAISHLPMLTVAEVQQLRAWNDTAVAYPQDLTLVDLFEQQVAKTPENLAVIFEAQSLTYRQLNAKANQLAHYLLDLTTFKKLSNLNGLSSPNPLIAIAVERSLEMVIGLLGILKAGGAYVPIDPSYPTARIHYMLKDSAAPLLLTQSHLQAPLSLETLEHDCVVVCLEEATWAGQPTENPLVNRQVEDLVYVIYTSGSTGLPKGVQITHRSLVNFLTAMRQQPGLTSHDTLLAVTTLSFDIAGLELYLPLLVGAKLVIVSREVAADGIRLLAQLNREAITVMQATPATWQLLVAAGWQSSPQLKILCGGEALSPPLASQLLAKGQSVWNLYGPTETTIWSTLMPLQAADLTLTNTITIGRPLANTSIYILDKQLQLVPVGVPGELYIGGAGLARGYLNRPELTPERFIANPFREGTEERLYKTGDLVRYLADGQIEYWGRLDTQVKLRGFRIELGEIEAVLGRHPAVIETAVVIHGSSPTERRLVAYLVMSPEPPVAVADLIKFLQARLPAYMLPAVFLNQDQLPRTPNGKIDRRALSQLDLSGYAPSEELWVAPSTPEEAQLAQILAAVLGVEAVGMFDNFFHLGGHSLLATQLMLKVREAFKVEVPLLALFESPTVAGLMEKIHLLRCQHSGEPVDLTISLPTLVPVPSQRFEPFPLTEVQQAYWLGRQSSFDLGNIATQIYLELECRDLDLARLTRAWQRLIEYHDMLRMTVLPTGQQQVLAQVPPYLITSLDLRGQSPDFINSKLETIRQESTQQISPTAQWPLFAIRATLLDEHRTRLHVSFDLLVADAWSMQLLGQEWLQCYREPECLLPPFELSFRDYVVMEQTWQTLPQYQRALDYWLNRLETLPPAPALPLACNPSELLQPQFKRRQAQLSAARWRLLKQRVSRAGLTPSGMLLAAFAELLSGWSKAPRFTLNLTLFNRLPVHPQVNELVGDFTSLLLVAVDHSQPASFLARAKRLQQQLWQDLEHRLVSGVRVQRELARRHGDFQPAAMPVVFTSILTLPVKAVPSPLEPLGKIVHSMSQTSQVWLDHQVYEDEEGCLCFNWDAVEDLFSPGFLDDLFGAYCEFLDQLVDSDTAWQTTVKTSLLVPSTHLAQRAALNATDAPITEDLLHTLFLAQVPLHGDDYAVISPQRSLTYAELAQWASHLGMQLRQLGAAPNTLVAVVMAKGWEQVVAVLGILMSGAAYLPIDPELPKERQWYLLEHGEVQLVLTQPQLERQLAWPEQIQRLCIDAQEQFSTMAELSSAVVPAPTDLAYVIFTSGSTGQPKGVMIDHRGAVNTILDINQRLGVTAQDRVFARSALNFDLSVYDIFGLLTAGGTIVIPEASQLREPAHWVELMTQSQVSIWNTVPALMQMLADYLSARADHHLPALRLIMMSGDWIPLTLPEKLQALWPEAQIISLGGATEASIWSIYYPLTTTVEPTWNSIPYGKPLRNQIFEVFNESLESRPKWVPGQLYIGGIGLAQGYWRDPEKTQASFIIHPQTQARWYKTGDLGRYLPDGNIEFLGREDFQVKIRGYRIELGEIETALQQHPAIKNAVVAAVGESRHHQQLVAYLVLHQSAAEDYTPSDTAMVLMEPIERLDFKLKQPGLRQVTSDSVSIALSQPPFDEQLTGAYLKRQSYRQFQAAPLSFEQLSQLLSCLQSMTIPGAPFPKYRYPSAGNLYPVQTYLSVKPGGIEGLAAGIYYYHPTAHRLLLIQANHWVEEAAYGEYGGLNQRIFEQATFALFLIGQLSAITPLYGEWARDFCLLEAGYMSQLLMEVAPAHLVGLCPIGNLEFDSYRASFELADSHLLLHSFLGGKIAVEQTQEWLPSAPQTVSLTDSLRHYLQQKLPSYMVPATYVRLEALPLTPNGKVDRQALPAPDEVQVPETAYVKPQNQVEQLIAEIWQQLLKVERVGIHDNFFDLGGDSLLVVQLQNKLQTQFNQTLSIAELFQYTTVHNLAKQLNPSANSQAVDGTSQRRVSKAVATRELRQRRQQHRTSNK